MNKFFVTPVIYLLLAILPVAVVDADEFSLTDYSQLSVSEAQIEQCAQKDQTAYQKVRDAIEQKQYELALELLGKPVKNRPRRSNPKEKNPGEVNYLYGKTKYLIAYETVNGRVAETPNQDQLAQAKKYIDIAAKQGFPEAIYDQAMLLTAANDNAEKLRLLKIAAEKKFVPAMLTLAEHNFYAIKTENMDDYG